MSQTTYNLSQAAAILGMLADSSFKHTESMIAAEKLPVGIGLMRVPNTADQCRLPKANYSQLVASVDLVASNSTVVTINSVALSAVVYATSHAATMAAIVTAIQGHANVVRCYLDSTNNKIIHIWTDIAVNDAAAATTGGAGQPTWTNTASFNSSDFYGICQLSSRLEGALPGSDNAAEYPAKSLVNVLRRGRIHVWFETAFDPDKDTLYLRYTANGTGKDIGQFRNDSDSSKAVSLSGLPVRVVSHLTAAGMGVIEINLP